MNAQCKYVLYLYYLYYYRVVFNTIFIFIVQVKLTVSYSEGVGQRGRYCPPPHKISTRMTKMRGNLAEMSFFYKCIQSSDLPCLIYILHINFISIVSFAFSPIIVFEIIKYIHINNMQQSLPLDPVAMPFSPLFLFPTRHLGVPAPLLRLQRARSPLRVRSS